MELIGLAGPARSGKDTVADYLSLWYNCKKFAFAKPLKDAAKIMFDLSSEQTDGSLKEEIDPRWGVSPRQIMQRLGTDFARDMIHKDVWIKRMQHEYDKFTPGKHAAFIVPDVRFENEADWIRKNNGCVVHLHRDDAPVVSAHVSEQRVALKDGDIVIPNNGSLDSLYKAIDTIVAPNINLPEVV